MAAAQAIESRAAMRPLSLLGVLVLAKILALWGRELEWSGWMPLAYVWQDLLVVGLYALLDWTLRREWLKWAAYGSIVLYVAINVPIVRVLSTPLTAPMLRAASGTLADSIVYYVSWPNLLCVAAVIAAGVALPAVLCRLRIAPRPKLAAMPALTLAVLLGPMASAHVATQGLHRNALVAMLTTALPRIAAMEHEGDWQRSPFGVQESNDLTRLHGAASNRNVVIIHLESTAARYLRPYGAAEDPMPNLTALAHEALLFENAYTVYPETIKSLVAVQSSVYPALDTEADLYERIPSPSLASELSRAGYRTGLFHSGRFRYLGMEAVLRNRGYDTLEDAGDIGGVRESSFGIDEESTLRRMLAWIDMRAAGQLFFLSYMPIAGHHPYNTPTAGPFDEERLIGRYRNALHYSDRIVGELVEGLRTRGLLDNTIIVILGDHGEAFGQHPGNIGHSLFIYEENVRIPYLILVPGVIRKTIRVRRAASVVDTAPTLLDLLGMVSPAAYQGRSLLKPQHGMALFCTDYAQGLIGLRDNQWKFIHNLDSGRSQLFNLELDPDERADVAEHNRARAEAYRSHLLRWSATQKAFVAKAQ
jgi:phosphoglycerol transferase MdoB-like AlkP superfamily enzyme